ncbi:class I SAM-dependent methyltransferase [Gammaproteobacteria bacterium]|nr:class I SAM-dependent methyltransferase [Gammaproteobacteria bacterium]
MYPRPSLDLLDKYYNDSYRKSEYAIETSNKIIDLPIQFPESASSFYRFKHFIDSFDNISKEYKDILPKKDDLMIDIGGYQGMFLYAAQQYFGTRGIVVDYSKSGVDYAKKSFGFTDSKAINSVYEYLPNERAKFVTMVHSLEHVDDPKRLLEHIRDNILDKNGYIYIEVPNLSGSPLSDPTHFYTFSKQSLEYLLNLCDIEILYLETAGNPHAPLTLSNDDLVLVCIARVSKEGLNPKVNNEDVWKKVINSYNIHSRKAIYLQMKKSITEIMKLFYYIFGHFILENITIHLHKTIQKIKALTSYRIH